MNKELMIEEEMKKYLVKTEDILDGTHYCFEFPNKYGASVVSHKFSQGGDIGLWELAVTKYNDEDGIFHLYYGTYLTDDVIGSLYDIEVMDYLKDIKNLENKNYKCIDDSFDIIEDLEGAEIDTVFHLDLDDLAALLNKKKLYSKEKKCIIVLDA